MKIKEVGERKMVYGVRPMGWPEMKRADEMVMGGEGADCAPLHFEKRGGRV